MFFSELGVTCELERHGDSKAAGSAMDHLALLAGAEDFRAELEQLEALPDMSEVESHDTLKALVREYERLFGCQGSDEGRVHWLLLRLTFRMHAEAGCQG